MLIKGLCSDFTVEGSGVVKRDGRIIFVPGLVPGDTAELEITADKKNYLLGRLKKISEPSPDRVIPACRHFGVCGGCTLQHYSYAAQLNWKRKFVEQSLRRIAGLTVSVRDIVPSADVLGYRNKAQLPFGRGGGLGYYRLDSHSVVDLQECPVQPPDFTLIVRAARDFARTKKIPVYDEHKHKGILRHLIIRKSDYLREILLGLAVNCRNFGLRAELDQLTAKLNEKLQTYRLTSIVANINQKKTNKILTGRQEALLGSGFITEKIGGRLFKVALNTFWQVNTPQAAQAYAQLAEWCAAGTNILDAYCGIGAIALTVADRADSIFGVEENPQAVRDARRSAENNGVSNARFICGRMEEQPLDALGAPNIIIADPPRKGLAARAAEQFLTLQPEKIIYLSCNPASLARDLKLFCQTGKYQIQEIIPYDFFPQTTHIETLVLMQKT